MFIGTRALGDLYAQHHGLDRKFLRQYLVHEFFYYDREKSDLYKTLIFCVLYCGGNPKEKTSILFDLMKDNDTEMVSHMSSKFLKILEDIVLVPTVITGDILEEKNYYQSELEKEEHQELMKLYANNHMIISEFSKVFSAKHLFPTRQESAPIDKFEFIEYMHQSDYLIVNPVELRNRYSQFVYQNKVRAQLKQPGPDKNPLNESKYQQLIERSSFLVSSMNHSMVDDHRGSQRNL
jgi:hypothetical protein